MRITTPGRAGASFIGARTGLRAAIFSLAFFTVMSALPVEEQIHSSDLYVALDEIAPHARSFPPHFSSPEERAQIEERLKLLLKQMDKISDRYPDDKDALFIKGAANAMGHNLDYPGCAEKAFAAFDRLLTIDPENRRALYEYGGFLSGTTLLDKSIPYLKKAIQLGEERAHYTLAFVYVKKLDPQTALSEFEAYLKFDPDNATAKKFVSEIKSGKFSASVVHHEATDNR